MRRFTIYPPTQITPKISSRLKGFSAYGRPAHTLLPSIMNPANHCRHSPLNSEPLPVLRSLDVELDPSPYAFGFLRDSHPGADDSSTLKARISEDGYLFMRNFWDREKVQRVRDSLTRQLAQLGFLSAGSRPDEARSNGREIGRAMGNPLDQHDPALRDLLFGDRMTSFFAEFLGGPVRHFDFIWFRTKGTGLGSPIHCDLVYMGRGTHQLYTAWVPLGDIPIDLGGLLILEGSHHKSHELRAYLSRDVDAYCENHDDAAEFASGHKWWDGTLSKNPRALQQSLGGRWLTAREFKMGDALIFKMTLVHGSLDNTTDRIRLSTDTRYQLANDPVDERWVGENPPGHTAAMKRGRVC